MKIKAIVGSVPKNSEAAAPGDYDVGLVFTLVKNGGQDTDTFTIDTTLHVNQDA